MSLKAAAPGLPSGQPWELYASLTTPVIVLDAEGRVLYLNPRAEAFWDLHLEDLAGRLVWELAQTSGRPERNEEWIRSVLFPALEAGTQLTTAATSADGRVRTAAVSGTWITQGDERFAVLTVAGEGIGPSVVAPPEWALRDPLTGLHNLHHWQQQLPEWDTRSGAIAFFDLDGLKEINDLNGHLSGDRALALTGQILAAEAPAGSLVVRYGGDEFLLVVGAEDAPGLPAVARRVISRAGEGAQAAGVLPLHLSFGIAAFVPGGLPDAVQRADDAMYEHKGVLMRAQGPDRIVLTRAGRTLVRGPGAEPEEQRPGNFAVNFGAEFDGYFRQAYARAAAQAREFVDFVSPRTGEAVVEVGAGSGRISFDGGLAERVGRSGQLLLTDPSAPQLQVARNRAQELGLDWVRFLQAPVEDLPLASRTVGLCLGSTFLHFSDPAVALRSMARIVRPGGRVAVNAWVSLRFGSGWMWALEPVVEEMRRRGIPLDGFLPQRSELEAAFAGAGLRVDQVEMADDQRGEFPRVEIALGLAHQIGLVRLLLRRAADEHTQALEQAFEDRLRKRFGDASMDWANNGRAINILAHRPD